MDTTHEEAEVIIVQLLLIHQDSSNTQLFHPAAKFQSEMKKHYHNDHHGIPVRYQAALDIEKKNDKQAAIIDNFTGCKYPVWM